MQTIEAIKHLKNKMDIGRNKMSLTDYDRKCLNRIIEHYNDSIKQVHKSQILFKKLFIHEFMKQAVIYNKGTNLALTNLEDLLRIPLSFYYEVFAKEAKFKKFQNQVEKLELVKEENLSDDPIEKELQILKNKDITERKFEDLKEILLNGYTPEQAKNFLENHIYEIILTYRNYD